MIPLGDYLPDLPANGTHATVANNCVPGVGYYAPFYTPVRYTSDATNGQVFGAAGLRKSDGTPYNFAGTATSLYKVTAGAWDDVSIVTNYTGATRWEFALFGNRVIATSIGDYPQSYVMGSSTLFANLTTALKARTVGVVRGFVMFGYTNEGGTEYPNRVKWSALEDPTDYTPSATTQSDYQDLFGEADIGNVQRVIGGETGIIFCERGIFAATYTGGDVIFQFDQIVKNQGTPAPGSVVAHGNTIFFLGNDGFYMLQGGSLIPIGEGKVNRTFLTELYTADRDMISATIDPGRSLYIVAYPTATGTLGKLIMYNWVSGRWTTATPGNLDCLFVFLSESTYTDSATAYDNPDTGAYADVPLDSPAFVGGVPSLAGVDASHYAVVFNGAPLTATFETGEAQITPGQKTLVTNIIPLVEGTDSSIYASVGVRNTPQETVTYTDESLMNSEGECNLFSSGRYQRAKLRVVNGFTKAYGVDFEGVPDGKY